MNTKAKPDDKKAWKIGVYYSRELHKYLLRRLHHSQDLDDLKQEVYMRLVRMDHMDMVREPLAYLYMIASNVVADFAIADQRRAHVTVDSEAVEDWADNPEAALPDDMAERVSLQRQLEKALNQLPPLQAAALIYHYEEGLSCEEIAKKLGLSLTSVDKYITRGKAKMRLMLWDR